MSRPLPALPEGFELVNRTDTPPPPAGFEVDQKADAPLRSSLMGASETAPDHHAEVLRLSQKSKLPPEIVDRNFDEIKKHVDVSEAEDIRKRYPRTATWLTDPNNSKIAKDDHEQLGHIETLLNLGKSFVSGGLGGAGQALTGIGNLFDVTGRAYSRAIQALGLPPIQVGSLPWWLHPLQSAGGELQADASFYQPTKQTFGTEVAGGLGQMVPLLVAGIIAGPEAGAAIFAGQSAEVFQERAEKSGKAGTPGADIGLLSQAAIGAVAGEFGIDKLLERVPPAIRSRFLQKLTDVTISGGYQAGLQVALSLANNIGTKLALDPNQPLTQDLFEQATVGGATGAIARAVLGIAIPSIGGKLQRAQAAQQSKLLFQALGEGVTDSKTFQRLPEKLQEFVKNATKDGPIENVYIPSDEAAQYFQDKNLDPEEVLGPEAAARYRQALQTGEDVQIPIEEYATRIAPSEHATAFNDIVRMGSPEAMNARESEEFSKSLQAPEPPEEQAADTSAVRVGEDIRGQLLGQGFEPKVVDSYAQLYESAFRAMGERSGQDPFALYEKYRLNVTRPLPEIIRTLPNIDTQLDPLIDRLRSGQRPTQEEMFGKSLVDFLRERGGLKDEGGELASREPDADRKPFEKRLIQKKGLELDRAREIAAEARYLNKQSSIADFLDAIDKELRGEAVHAQGGENPEAVEQNIILEQLDQYLKQRGVDIQTASNAEIKKVLNQAAQVPVIDAATGQLLEQSPYQKFATLIQKQRGAEGLQAAVKGNSGKIYTGAWHGEAIDRAHAANDFTPQTVNETPESRQGFLTSDGRFLTREESDKEFGVKFSEDIKYDQTLGLDKRGTIHFGPDRQFSIELLKGADLSTFLHETGHFYLEVFGDIVDDLKQRGELNETQQRMLLDYENALRWLGVESRDKIGREQHEQFTRGFEAYLREGKAPNPEIRTIFARFKAWLVNIYRSLSQLNVTLNPEIRAVFDRLLASDEDIRRAQEDAGIRAMIESQGQAERLGLSPDEYRVYGKTVQDAADRARERLDSEYLEEFNRQSSEWFAARKQEVRTQVAAEVHGQKDYMVLSFLKDGKLPDGSPLPDGVEPFKLDGKALEERYGKYKDSTVMQQLRKLDIYRREGGVDPDAAADQFGYSSGDELVQVMVNARPMEALIDAETDDRMKHTYGDILTDGTAPEKARDAVMTEGRAKVIQAEMKALAKTLRKTEPIRKLGERQATRADREARTQGMEQIHRFVPSIGLARDIANDRIAALRVRDVKPSVYYAAARKESAATNESVNAGNFDEALTHKQRELINVEMYRAATDTVKEVEKIRDRMRSFDDPKKRGRIGKAGEEYLDQIDKLRERFEFSRQTTKALDKRASLQEFMESERTKGHELDIPLDVQNEAKRQNYRDMTVQELRGLNDAVRTIEHWAQFKNKLLRQQEKRELDALGAEGVASIDGNHRGGPGKPLSIEQRLPGSDKGRKLQSFLLAHLPLGSILREMDGFKDGGFLFENVMRPIDEAGNAEAVRLERATKAVTDIYNQAYKGAETALWEKQFIPEINDSLTKWGRLMVALNWGNDGNRQRVMGGFGWNEGQVKAILDTLDEKDWKFVQNIWDHINSYWVEISDKQQRVTGVRPEKVEASPIQTKFGEVKGGYFPIVYESRLSARAEGRDEASFAKLIEKASYTKATTARGHTETRLKNVSDPLRLDPGVITEHLQQVIHDLTHHEMLIDVGRILNKTRDAIQRNYGDVALKEIRSHVRDIALGSTPSPDWYRTYAAIRSNAVTARLGWNAVTALIHVPNITSGMVRVGPKWVAKGVIDSLSSAKGAEHSAQWVAEQSDMMRLRWKHRMVELSEFRDQIGLNRGKLSSEIHDAVQKLGIDPDAASHFKDSYLYAIHRILQFAEIPTWVGAYEKAMASGREANDARAQADRAILDAIGGGQMKDVAAIQQGAIGKIFTTFMTYQLSMHRLGREVLLKDEGALRKMVDASLLVMLPVAFVTAVHHLARPTKKAEDFGHALLNEGFDHAVGMFAGVRELAGAFQKPDYQGPASFGVIGSLRQAAYRVAHGEGKAHEYGKATVKAINEAAGELFGYPAAQVNKTIEGALALWEGKTRNPSVLLFGPSRK